MVSFRVSIRKDFGEVSIEGEDEKEIIDNIGRLKPLEKLIEKTLGFDLKIPESALTKFEKLEYLDRVMIMMTYLKRPVTKLDCKNYTNMLQIPEHWWNGSNFERDMQKREKKGFIRILKAEKPQYVLTTEGKKHAKSLT